MHSRHHESQQEKATGKRVNTANKFDNHNQSNEISHYIMNVSRKKRLANVLPLLYLTITIKAMKYYITCKCQQKMATTHTETL
jgi:hypothetical protein